VRRSRADRPSRRLKGLKVEAGGQGRIAKKERGTNRHELWRGAKQSRSRGVAHVFLEIGPRRKEEKRKGGKTMQTVAEKRR